MRPNITPKTIKLLEENKGQPQGIKFSNDFFAMTPKSTVNKIKN